MSDANKIVSEKILSVMKSRNITRADLADAAGIGKTNLDNYLQQKARWNVESVRRIFFILDISFDELFNLSNSVRYTLKSWTDYEDLPKVADEKKSHK